MTKTTRNDRSSEPSCRLMPSMPEAFDDLRMSVDRFCLLAGLESLNEMMSADAEALCGSRHARSGESCQRRSKIGPPGRSKTSPLNVMRYAVLGGCPGSP